MKLMLIAVVCLMSVSVSACSKEDTKVTIPVVEIAQAADAPKFKLKMVCKDALDKAGNPIKNADGTVRQTCKEIRVREKYEGKPVPGQK